VSATPAGSTAGPWPARPGGSGPRDLRRALAGSLHDHWLGSPEHAAGASEDCLSKLFPLLCSCWLLLGAATAVAAPRAAAAVVAADAELRSLAAAVREANGRAQGLRGELRKKQELHAHLAARIEELKEGPVQSFRLEALQRNARAMADEVRMLQQSLVTAQEAVRQARTRLATTVRQRLAALERQAPREPERRLAWVERQEELLGLLQQYEPVAASAALPVVPTGQIRSTDGPEELREAADELADVGEKYLGHAASLARRIQEVLKQERLARLADDLARQEGLFDDAVRYRKVSRVTMVPSATSGKETETSGKTGTPTTPGSLIGGEGESESDGTATGGLPGGDEADGDFWNGDDGHSPEPAGEYQSDEPAVPGNGAEMGGAARDDGIPVAIPGELGDVDLAGGVDPGRSSGGSVEARIGLRADVDPTRGLVDPRDVDTLDLAAQLRLLEQQHKAATQRGQHLLRQSRALRQRAEQLEDREGF